MKTINQASNMKEDLEKLKIKKSKTTIITIDIEAVYLSVQFIQVKRGVELFLWDAPKEDKDTAQSCLEMARFGM